MSILESLPRNKKIELSNAINNHIKKLEADKTIYEANQKLSTQKKEIKNEFDLNKDRFKSNNYLFNLNYKIASYNINRINLELLRVEQAKNKNNYYKKRLEIINRILLSGNKDNDDLYYELVRILKHEMIINFKDNMNIARSNLYINNEAKSLEDFKNVLSKESERKYSDLIVENDEKIKKILTSHIGIGGLKNLNFAQLTTFDCQILFDKILNNNITEYKTK